MMSSENISTTFIFKGKFVDVEIEIQIFPFNFKSEIYLTWNDKQTNSIWNGVNIYKAPLQEIIKPNKKKKSFRLTLKNYLRFNEFHEFNKEFCSKINCWMTEECFLLLTKKKEMLKNEKLV